MTDLAARQAQRLAAQGDPEAERALLVQAIRADDHRLDMPTRCRYCDTGRERLLVRCWFVHPSVADDHSDCPVCAGTGLVTLPWEGPAGRLDALAYAGHAGARELAGKCERCQPWTPHRACTSTRCRCCKGVLSIEGFCHPCQEFDPAYLERGKCAWHRKHGSNCWAPDSLAAWLSGLARWPADLAAVAALGAAWAALPVWERTPRHYTRALSDEEALRTHEAPRAALNACADYLACGCEGSWEAWCRSLDPLRPRSPDMLWLPWTEPFYPEADGTEIRHAARLLGSEDTRAAACGALTAWLLGRGVPREAKEVQ